MNPNTKKLLEDLRNAGIDTSSIERQIAHDALADRQLDMHLGAGILRQQEYTRYMNDLVAKEQQIQQQVQQLATLHDAQNNPNITLPEETINVIKKMEEALIATGEFDEQSIKTISYQGRVPLEKMIKDRQQPQPQQFQQQQNNNLNPTNLGFQPQQPQIDTSKFVDVGLFRQALGNLAYGDIATNMEINARLDEVRQLGIPVDRSKIAKLQENLKKNFEGNGSLDQAFEETFEVSKAIEAKQNADIEKRINDEAEKRTAEALKNAGVPVTKKFNAGRHVIFDRKRSPENVQAPNQETKTGEGNNNAEVIPSPNQPNVNKYGDTEIFRTRGDRNSRMQNAAGTYEQVMEHYANDPTYVE